MVASFRRSSRSSAVHRLAVSVWFSDSSQFDGGTEGLASDVLEDGDSEAPLKASCCSVCCPKLRPRRLVVGVPVTIHRRSTLIDRENSVRFVEVAEVT
jgi:hypothetical protein